MKRESLSEFDKFDKTMRKLISVPHSEIKAKLEAERAAKKESQKGKATNDLRKTNRNISQRH